MKNTKANFNMAVKTVPSIGSRFLAAATLLLLAVGILGVAEKVQVAGKRPNVVVLLADDLGSTDIGCYGGAVKTPALDSLGARGVRFTDFHAACAICSPSRASLLTGRPPYAHGRLPCA